eukprot:CAMPEP_0205915802 /NCGR_PEP_ID=MMETSP1325-20131115/8107_1 /ASSEMBLY_ACC=CAM_ASM_000708 /TAXON_ID=236786 /ORGANISM="Florenciella sp., Strain RCC1007" /LENGTH=96 /DNA_ID=CAMNT_0053283021 /DNA_START=1 /DNA_END=288 /DNA_ORIENTATION=-
MFSTPLPNPSAVAKEEQEEDGAAVHRGEEVAEPEPKGAAESKGDEPDGASMEEAAAPTIQREDSELDALGEGEGDGDGSMRIGHADAEHLFNTPLP